MKKRYSLIMMTQRLLAVAFILSGVCFSSLLYSQTSENTSGALPLVKAIDLSTIDPSMFTVEEWYVPYYLKNFAAVANSVVSEGENKGYIDIVVWRAPDVNRPYNARIMESILSLVWFYTHQRPWNVYYGDPALKARIEAALTFWCNMQHTDGRFSEYAPQQWNLAATAFATKFIGRALVLLHESPSIDAAVLERTKQAIRKALYVTFTDKVLWEHGRNFTNQYENAFGGVLMYLKVYPDAELEKLFVQRLEQSMKEFQSPCGYFYEKNGPDWGYNLSTHHSDLHVAWHYAKGTSLEKYFVEKTKKWYDWFSYNAVKEPESNRFYLNKAVETRQQRWQILSDTLENPSAARWTPQAEFVPEAHPFIMSKEEYDKATQQYYKRMRERYPEVEVLQTGKFWSFSPYAFLHNELIMWFPSAAQKQQAVKNLPYLKNLYLTEVRSDARNKTSHSFIRRPSYYTIFNAGNVLTPTQRLGLGLIWHPKMGTMLQSQSNSITAAWGTKPLGTDTVYEAGNITAEFKVQGNKWEATKGINRPEGTFDVSYSLNKASTKQIAFNPDNIKITIKHSGNFTEVLPLLVEPGASLLVEGQTITLKTSKGKLMIKASKGAVITKSSELISTRSPKSCQVVEISAKDKLEYEFSFTN